MTSLKLLPPISSEPSVPIIIVLVELLPASRLLANLKRSAAPSTIPSSSKSNFTISTASVVWSKTVTVCNSSDPASENVKAKSSLNPSTSASTYWISDIVWPAAKESVSTPPPDTMVSVPCEALNVSLPNPPSRTSSPAPPSITSSPVPA